MVTGLPARRDPCDDKLRQATLVEFRGSILSDAGSIPAISTEQTDQQLAAGLSVYNDNDALDNYIRDGYSLTNGDYKYPTPYTGSLSHPPGTLERRASRVRHHEAGRG